MEIRPTSFSVRGTTLRGDVYLPGRRLADGPRPPVVVMAHGFGAWRSFGLPAYAERFAAAGSAVLLFDHRTLGESDGEPRGLVDIGWQREDWEAAVAHARSLPEVDGARVALWGTSFAGGHALVTAARVGGIAAVVAQVPHVDGLASAARYPLRLLPGAVALALLDRVRSALGGEPVRVPIVGPRGVRCLVGDDVERGARALVPEGTAWLDRVPARILLSVVFDRPIRELRRVSAPVLIVAATRDALIPITAVRRAAARLPRGRLVELDMTHFAAYEERFEEVVAIETAFLREHLRLA